MTTERKRTADVAEIDRALARAAAKACCPDAVTRFEVIDRTGRAYVRYGVSIELSYQDEGRTLKVFVEDSSSSEPTP